MKPSYSIIASFIVAVCGALYTLVFAVVVYVESEQALERVRRSSALKERRASVMRVYNRQSTDSTNRATRAYVSTR